MLLCEIRVHKLLARVRTRPFEVVSFRPEISRARVCDGNGNSLDDLLDDHCEINGQGEARRDSPLTARQNIVCVMQVKIDKIAYKGID